MDKTKHRWSQTEPGIKELSQESVVHARLQNFKGSGKEIKFSSTPKMRKDRVFSLTIGGEEAIIDLDQFTWYARLY